MIYYSISYSVAFLCPDWRLFSGFFSLIFDVKGRHFLLTRERAKILS
ncbi:hypothetical protein PORCRE_1547 [Porphyromonas crevioricanis JCM 15906]|uniref:Uncharacterized protein n=1 Tax=Porphyromonas crevioricanis JCM 15906 TaxID=1305617 RepID=T1CRW5_9PORP|nr:hypothetical protein PORCRE_1547 [Porphyromonas crevioricanis JCM 15906]